VLAGVGLAYQAQTAVCVRGQALPCVIFNDKCAAQRTKLQTCRKDKPSGSNKALYIN